MKQLILIFIGGGFGSVLRYLLSRFLSTQDGIPYGTFVANVSGSFLIGVVLGFAIKNQTLTQNQTYFLATGFCGGFTTFSSFAYENHIFLKSGDFLAFLLYTSISFILAIAAVFGGFFITKII